MPVVLDASAYLAYLLGEPGADTVEEAMVEGAVMSAVNLAEVLTKRRQVHTGPTYEVRARLGQGSSQTEAVIGLFLGSPLSMLPSDLPGIPRLIHIEEFFAADAQIAAALWHICQGKAQSLGDRVCLALGYRLKLPVLTADREWGNIDLRVLDLEVRLIR